MTTQSITNPINRSSGRCGTRGFIFITLVLACFGLAPMAQAVGPDTDGTIPGSNNGEGIGVLVSRTSGVWNTGTGFEALSQLTAGNQNTATGLRALTSDTNGGYNTATGVFSLFSNTGGFFNSATGAYSLANNLSGNHNTANGYAALYRNTADNNTATGFAALYSNTTGFFNTADGDDALMSNSTGGDNTATGTAALFNNTTGYSNTANGFEALFHNITGFSNTANGYNALDNNTNGNGNIALGASAGSNLTSGNNNIYLGSNGAATESNTIRIGTVNVQDRAFIRGIRGTTTGNNDAIAVVIDTAGQLGTTSSSRRYKKDIKAMEQASKAILSLKPVTFHYKSDTKGTPQFGLIAEEVADVNPDLVVREENGEIYTVRYDAVNAMLLNEFLKAHHKAQQQETTVAQLKSAMVQQRKDFEATAAQQQKEIQALTASLKDQAAQIQKVSAQLAAASPSRGGLEVDKPAPQMVSGSP